MIYAAFISLGLPDSAARRGVAGHAARVGRTADSGRAFNDRGGRHGGGQPSADRMLHRFGTGRVTLVSVTMTACALLGYALAPGFWWFALAAVPMGLGAGAVDAG